jgi:hypothetical protein
MTPCPLCRTEIDDAQSRCPACGTRVKRDAAPVPPPAWTPAAVASTIAPATVTPVAPAPAAAAPPPPPPGGPAYYGSPSSAPGTLLLGQAAPLPMSPPIGATWAPPAPVLPKRGRVGRAARVTAAVVGGVLLLLFGIGFVAGSLDNHRANDAIHAYTAGRGETFVAPAGEFTATFPTHPMPVDQTMQADDGSTFVFHDFVSRPGKQFVFEVGYLDVSPSVALPDANAALEGMVDAMAAELQGTVTSRAPSTLDDARAEDFTVEYQDNGRKAVAVSRVALHGGRVYLLAVTARGLQQEGFDRLVSSFHFGAGSTS